MLQSNESTNNIGVYEQLLKKLLKTYDVSMWQEMLQDTNFINFLINYTDEKNNNVYHLLFKVSKTNNDKIGWAMDISKMLLDMNIPVWKINNDGKTPSDIAFDKTFWFNILLRREDEECAKLLYESGMAWDDI